MVPKFIDQPFLAELVAFFTLTVVWMLSGILAAITAAAVADLIISGLAWRIWRHKADNLGNNAGS